MACVFLFPAEFSDFIQKIIDAAYQRYRFPKSITFRKSNMNKLLDEHKTHHGNRLVFVKKFIKAKFRLRICSQLRSFDV